MRELRVWKHNLMCTIDMGISKKPSIDSLCSSFSSISSFALLLLLMLSKFFPLYCQLVDYSSEWYLSHQKFDQEIKDLKILATRNKTIGPRFPRFNGKRNPDPWKIQIASGKCKDSKANLEDYDKFL